MVIFSLKLFCKLYLIPRRPNQPKLEKEIIMMKRKNIIIRLPEIFQIGLLYQNLDQIHYMIPNLSNRKLNLMKEVILLPAFRQKINNNLYIIIIFIIEIQEHLEFR